DLWSRNSDLGETPRHKWERGTDPETDGPNLCEPENPRTLPLPVCPGCPCLVPSRIPNHSMGLGEEPPLSIENHKHGRGTLRVELRHDACGGSSLDRHRLLEQGRRRIRRLRTQINPISETFDFQLESNPHPSLISHSDRSWCRWCSNHQPGHDTLLRTNSPMFVFLAVFKTASAARNRKVDGRIPHPRHRWLPSVLPGLPQACTTSLALRD